ncbi:MAG: hypothetical protein LBG43_02120 [Treponema sp.]|nr:hypothetical protein [Treponema sp.]
MSSATFDFNAHKGVLVRFYDLSLTFDEALCTAALSSVMAVSLHQHL